MTCDIVGIGAVASIGGDPRAIFGALCEGRTGRAELRAFDRSRFRAQFAYEIDDRPEPGKDEPHRATRWLRQAISQASADAGLTEIPSHYPLLIGTTLHEQRTAELWWRKEIPLSPRELRFGASGDADLGLASSYTFANACAASLCALALATDMIDLGMADTVIVAGADCITESVYGVLDRVQNSIPDAVRPFDTQRRGMLPGEGAVAVVLRREGLHQGTVHGRLRAVAMNCDAGHPTAPDKQSIAAAVREAHQRAGLSAADIDLVMLHGTGTPLNDVSEAAVLGEIFSTPGPLMTAIKSGTGHTLGASGLMSLVTALLAMSDGIVPPIAGLSSPVPEADGLRLVHGGAERASLRTAQVNAFGFGGINAVAAVQKAER
jgi:3-oxoacyl-[acyl-carrier-protein] synthase II